VLLDSFGTLVGMDPPGPHLRAELRRLSGVDVGETRAAEAFATEIDHYLAHHLEGRDPDSLDGLRDRCAEVLREALGHDELDQATVRSAMLSSLRFTPYEDSAPALRELRGMGLRLVVCSNWDCSLREVLREAGLLELVDGVVSSSQVGVDKPDPAVFDAALETAGVTAEEALHVGDSRRADIEGARAAGITAVLVVRDGGAPPRTGEPFIRSLGELPRLVASLS